MNINTIRKHYDKLTTRERFAAIVAASEREDEIEIDALVKSAPRNIFSFPDTYGLAYAFHYLATWHVTNQLGLCASVYYLILVAEDENKPVSVKIAGESFSFEDSIDFLTERILTNCEAWNAICREYSIDPSYLLSGLPYIEMIELTELTARMFIETPLELPDLQNTTNRFRKVIETKCKEWE